MVVWLQRLLVCISVSVVANVFIYVSLSMSKCLNISKLFRPVEVKKEPEDSSMGEGNGEEVSRKVRPDYSLITNTEAFYSCSS